MSDLCTGTSPSAALKLSITQSSRHGPSACDGFRAKYGPRLTRQDQTAAAEIPRIMDASSRVAGTSIPCFSAPRKIGPATSVELRGIPGGNIFLHRAAPARRSPLEKLQHHRHVQRCPGGRTYRTYLVMVSLNDTTTTYLRSSLTTD